MAAVLLARDQMRHRMRSMFGIVLRGSFQVLFNADICDHISRRSRVGVLKQVNTTLFRWRWHKLIKVQHYGE